MRLTRSRLVALVAAIVCVAIAAATLRVTEVKPPYEAIRGRVGAPVAVDDGKITIDDVRVGSQLTRDGSVTDTTPGMFLVVRVHAAATGAKRLERTESRLITRDDRIYSPYGFTSVGVAPGFVEEVDYAFEVDPRHIDDLTLEIWQVEIISGFQQRLQVHLGITPANAAQWRAAAVGQGVETDTAGSTRVIS